MFQKPLKVYKVIRQFSWNSDDSAVILSPRDLQFESRWAQWAPVPHKWVNSVWTLQQDYSDNRLQRFSQKRIWNESSFHAVKWLLFLFLPLKARDNEMIDTCSALPLKHSESSVMDRRGLLCWRSDVRETKWQKIKESKGRKTGENQIKVDAECPSNQSLSRWMYEVF